LLFDVRYDSGIFFGAAKYENNNRYIGLKEGTEGNLLIVGGNGCGKTHNIVETTLATYKGAIAALDIKGELSNCYNGLYSQHKVQRPCIIFDPNDPKSPGFGFFDGLDQTNDSELLDRIRDIVMTIIPILPNESQPFWAETEQAILEAGLLFFCKSGLGFIESLLNIFRLNVSSLCETILASDNELAKAMLGEAGNMKPEQLAAVDRGIRNKISPFVTDKNICEKLKGKAEGANCFSWKDLENNNIFLKIPEDKIEKWGPVINLIYEQLLHYLERRPDKYSEDGKNNIQTLLLMDEFARLGKLAKITSDISTLRSKNVNFCLIIQSVAQLDKIYGEYDRRIIFDNCQFQVIMRSNDAETQKYFSELIGMKKVYQRSVSEHEDAFHDVTGYSKQLSETFEPHVLANELAFLSDIIILSPYGFCRAEKNLLRILFLN